MSVDTQNIPHDKGDQLQSVLAGLIAGEQVFAVYDCHGSGTGFVAVTSLRVIFQDNSFIGGKSAVTSLPIRSIQSVSFLSDKSMFGRFSSSATVAITAGSRTVEATFRADDKAKHIHDTILWLISR
ncbi:MAG TPA: hypothetical protein VGC57_13365 [Cellulomonas sp.]